MPVPLSADEVEQLKALADDPVVSQRKAGEIMGKSEKAIIQACHRRGILWKTNYAIGKFMSDSAQKRREAGFVAKATIRVSKQPLEFPNPTPDQLIELREYAARPEMSQRAAAYEMDWTLGHLQRVLLDYGIEWVTRSKSGNGSKKRAREKYKHICFTRTKVARPPRFTP